MLIRFSLNYFKQMTLADCPTGETFILNSVEQVALMNRLFDLGIRQGNFYKLITKAPMKGPLLIQDSKTSNAWAIRFDDALFIQICSESAKR